ncbi:MAG TPA: transketolase [Thermoanaerobaculia bacterium]|nr:transketolase [Thermoanaerobaculia bacterium]
MTETAAATSTDLTTINTIRFLAVDMVEKAKSGHPGAPLGMAPMAWVLWSRFLRFDPAAPDWPGRDRFVLSAGHASALLYSLLHLAGYDLPMEELRRFRQLGSKTPGHPEHGLAPGVETTTGPLGQGLGNAVGMAIAQRALSARFDPALFDYRVWVIASDGDMMEGIGSEASSLAGHLRLGALNVLYDANHISIDGSTDLAFSEDVAARFAAYGWHVQTVEDGNDLDALHLAMEAAAAERTRPSLIRVHTVIGFGSPKKAGTAKAHGEPLGPDEARATKRALGWPEDSEFSIPDEAREAFGGARERGEEAHAAWNRLREAWGAEHPELASELDRRLRRELPADWDSKIATIDFGSSIATRAASGKVINAIAPLLPELLGGSADLTESNQTLIEGVGDFAPDNPTGRYLRYGVREHAMASAMNGLALSGFRPYGGTFLIFSDYARPSIRLAALMQQPVVYVFTHDSIFLGEDGPTHEPIEQLAALRAIPNLVVLRPGDSHETAHCWRVAIERRQGPTALALTRQKLPVLDEAAIGAAEGVARGGYVLADAVGGKPELLLLATGSEVHVALEARKLLVEGGVRARVVSLPSFELFAAQPQEYRDAVLPPAVTRRLAVEAARPFGWDRWVGPQGEVLGLDRFGESGKYEDLAKHFGFTAENVAARARALR